MKMNVNEILDVLDTSDPLDDSLTTLDSDGFEFTDSPEIESEIIAGLNEISVELQANITPSETTTPAPTTAAPTKMDQCRSIYNELTAKQTRRCDIIKAFMTTLNISKAHASTYYQTIHIKSKAAAPVAQTPVK